ncbi:MAG: V-type ATP synthase subunit A, partial [Bacteroidales bacterium]|nr:V-type ATP synthase subunit A [Bacteroidales bacterium]
MTTGKVTSIISNLVVVQVDGPVGQNEICMIEVGDTKIMAEVIKIVGDKAYTQVFENTRGLKVASHVEFQGHMLELTLGPGLLSRNFDGLQNDLERMDGVFLKRGEYTQPLDFE